jgi:type IV secretory pathway protease TraF
MPKGVYVRTNRPVHEGCLVIVPSSVLLSLGEKLPKYLLKKVLCYHGEIVTINQVGLFLNSTLIARREFAKGVYYKSALPPGLVVLVGESERSFDSRYFGPVRITDLTEVKPILTW